jgi:riboflavin kinase/FMN adenylyltransferase
MRSIKIIKGLENFRAGNRRPVLTIGNFDGVHVGHQRILRRVAAEARRLDGTPLAMSFDPHPLRVLAPEKDFKLLTTNEEKARIMGLMGIEVLLLVNFTREFASLVPDDFIDEILVGKLRPQEIIVGHNYAFGKAKKGTTALLRRRGVKYGFRLSVVRHARIRGKVVSSSRVRALLERGLVEEAAEFLGRPYMTEGVVVKGAGRGGKLLGYPTANIDSPFELMPREGVYAVKAVLENKVHRAVANIGKNPTFGAGREVLEVHIPGFNRDILGRTVKVYFIARLRDEETFTGPDALRRAIAGDIKRANDVLRSAARVCLNPQA